MSFNKRLRLAKEKFEAGKITLQKGNYQQALELFSEAAKSLKGIEGQEINYAACLVNAGNCLQELSDYKKAQTFIEKALSIQRKNLNNEASEIADSLHNLAIIYFNQENYKIAKEYCEEALAIREKRLGHEHPNTASTLNNLANIYGKQKNYEMAIFHCEKALVIREKRLGHEHPDTATTLGNLAVFKAEQGNLKEAKKLNQEALTICEQKLGTEHPNVYININNLSKIILAENPNETIESIAQLHESLIIFLSDKNLLFTLRTSRNDEQGRLSKGYWFLGNEDYLYFSFWQGIDTTNQMPTISLVIDNNQQLSIYLNAKDSKQKAEFLQDLTQLLDGFSQSVHPNTGELENQWRKTYTDKNWQTALTEFIETDKNQIDSYLTVKNNQIEDFTFLNQKEFIQNLKLTILLITKKKIKASKTVLTDIGQPLKLHALQLTNIGHFSQVGFDLSKQITILIGENGSGKSTVLKAIALALCGIAQTIDNNLTQNYLKILSTDADEDKQLLKKNYSNQGKIYLNFQINKLQNQTVEFEYNELTGVQLRTFVENNDDWLLARKNRFIDLILGFPQGKKRGQKQLGKIKAPNLNDLIALIEDRDIAEWKQDIVDWLYDLYRVRTEQEQQRNDPIIDTLFKIFSKIVTDDSEENQNAVRLKNVVRNADTGNKELIITTPDMPNGIALDLISQGYTNVFIWVGRLIMRLYDALETHQQEHLNISENKFLKNDNHQGKRYPVESIHDLHGIILIDEIDTYLHPKWQRNILRFLADQFPNLQWVVTSHSPLVLGYLKQWQTATVLKIQNNQIVPIQHFYGRNPIDLFWELHEIESRPQEIQQKITNLYELFDDEKIHEAKLQLVELKEILGSNDAIVTELETAIDLMESL